MTGLLASFGYSYWLTWALPLAVVVMVPLWWVLTAVRHHRRQ